jgi:hypothetical protein
MIQFEWDDAKARTNFNKHGVTFDEAIDAFRDPLSVTTEDAVHSQDEQRLWTIGQTRAGRLIVVSHTFRDDYLVRVVSAREPEPEERRRYEHGTG